MLITADPLSVGQTLLEALDDIHYLKTPKRKHIEILGDILIASRHMKKIEPDR